MTLYELTAEYMQLLEIAEDPDTDVQVLLDTMEGVSGEIEEKADGSGRSRRKWITICSAGTRSTSGRSSHSGGR
jgi:hypothetical protein